MCVYRARKIKSVCYKTHVTILYDLYDRAIAPLNMYIYLFVIAYKCRSNSLTSSLAEESIDEIITGVHSVILNGESGATEGTAVSSSYVINDSL